MQIEIPPNEQQRLQLLATEAGYSDVERFVTEHVLALASQPSSSELAPLSEAELEASLSMIDKSMTEFEAGGGISLEEAQQRSLDRLKKLAQ